jgi:hypothetical protein
MPKINREDLFSYEYQYPACNEQQNIVNYLDSIQFVVSEMRALLDQKAKLLDRLERSILKRAFRGEL